MDVQHPDSEIILDQTYVTLPRLFSRFTKPALSRRPGGSLHAGNTFRLALADTGSGELDAGQVAPEYWRAQEQSAR